MALMGFGHFAVDWSHIYLLSVVKMNFELTVPSAVAVYADVPGSAPGQPLATIELPLAELAWNLAKSDGRFTVIKNPNGNRFAVDMSRIRAVVVSPDGKSAGFSVELSTGEGATIHITPEDAKIIIGSLPVVGASH
jgi:hypothetical protein